ncbi:MAG: hypothetical protein R2806_25420 [Saprospiraceae bacterium]|nr:hypothetical protein [Lewinella sp.]
MYPKIIGSLAVGFFLFSCGNDFNKSKLELNNGKKWTINAEMMPPLSVSEKLLSEYAAGDKKDYKRLAAQLKESNQLLISSCTMKGKSHDELHKWLYPYMALVDELNDAENENEANQVFQKIKESFETFNQYFQ